MLVLGVFLFKCKFGKQVLLLLLPAQHPCPTHLHSSDASPPKMLRGFSIKSVKLIKKKGHIFVFISEILWKWKLMKKESRRDIWVDTYSPSCGNIINMVIRYKVFVTAMHGYGQRRKLIVSLHGKWNAFMIWGDGLFMMPLDGNVKEYSLSLTWGYFDIVLDNE